MSRVPEQYLLYAIKTKCDEAAPSCTFYVPEVVVDLKAVSKFASISVSVSDEPMREGDNVLRGTIEIFISARQSLGDIHAARKIADALSSKFHNQSFEIKQGLSVIGYFRTLDPVSNSIGMTDDGLINHSWQCEFIAYTL